MMAFPQLTKLELMATIIASGLEPNKWDSNFELAREAIAIAEQILKQTAKKEQNGD